MYISGSTPSENQIERRLTAPQLTDLSTFIDNTYSPEQKADIPALTAILNTKALINNPDSVTAVDRPPVTKKVFMALLEGEGITFDVMENIFSKKVFDVVDDFIDFGGALESKVFTFLKDQNIITTQQAALISGLKLIDDPDYQTQIPGTSPAEDTIQVNIILEAFDVQAAINGAYREFGQ